MRTFVTLAPVLLILQCVCLAASSVDLIVVSEQTAQGAKLARPTSEHPAYYLAFDAGCLDARAGIGGLKRPAGAAVEQTLRNALRSEGYEGHGIAEDVRAHLFEPGRTGRPGGSGLGLAISQLLARQIGATLALDSTGTDGTTFSISLPIIAA